MRTPILASIAFVAATGGAAAEPAPAPKKPTSRPVLVTGKVHVAMLGDADRAVADKPLVVAVELTVAPGYHIYWTNPGETGLPTTVKFAAPAGFTVGPVRFPGPKRFESAGKVMAYGYEGTVVVSSEVTAPASGPRGPIALSATVDYLACKADECVPGKLSTTLEPGPAPGASPALLARHLAELPRPLAELAGVTTSWSAGKAGPILAFTLPGPAPTKLDYFPSAAETVRIVGQRTKAETAGTHFAVAYKPGPRPVAAGLLVVNRGQATTYYQLPPGGIP